MTPTDRAHPLSITATGNGWSGYRSGCRATIVLLAGLLILRDATIADVLQKQVLIEPKFVEVNDKNLRDLGWNAGLAEKLAKLPPEASKLSSPNATNLGLGPSPSQTTVTTHLFPGIGGEPKAIQLSGLVTDPQLQVILNALGEQKGAKIISAPALRIHSNEPANIQIPSAGFQGVKLEVVPRINRDGKIEMTVTPSQSAELSKETDGNTPIIQDIPVLGALFRDKHGGKEDLLIFVKARVIDVLEPWSGDGKSDQIKVETVGTGETIGHIADLKITNLSDQQLVFVVPPMVLESKSRTNQDYACPNEENVSLPAHGTKTVPIDGVCVDRSKPPVSNDVSGDLVLNTGDPSIPQSPDSHIPANQARDLLRICTSKYVAADKLQKDGALRDLPYKDKQKQKDIVVQWSTWCDPRISQITGAPPATKDDLKKVVYKQVEAKGKTSPETKKKVDQGIDTIFEKVELTTAKAKDVEKPEPLLVGAVTTGKPGAFFKPATVAQPGDIAHVEDRPRGGNGHWSVKVKLPSGEIVEVWFESDEPPPLEFCNTIKIHKTHTSSPGHNTIVDDYVKNPSPTPTATSAPTQPPTVPLSATPTPTSTSTATPAPTSTSTQPPQPPGPAEKTEPEKPKTEAAPPPAPRWTPPDLPDWLKPWWQAVQYVVTGSEFTSLPSGKDTLGGIIARVNKKITEECGKAGREKECEFYEELRDKLTKVYQNL